MADQIHIDEKEMEKLKKQAAKKKGAQEAKKEGPSTGSVVAAIVAIAYFVLLFFGKFFLPADGVFMSSIDVFNKSDNVNHIIRVASLCILTLSISAILRYFIGRMAKNKDITKKTGVAVIELLGNLVKYVAFLVLVFLVLSALGVDTTSLLAGLGIISLIIGLGVTSLIEDIVAGIFIIAEHLFDVGDVIVLDGFRGTVVQIGIRSTQIVDVGGDVLIVRNSSIGSLVNLTDRLSSGAITFPIAPQESIENLEKVVKNSNFEKIGEKYPSIQSGPLYLGVCGIDSKGVQSVLLVAGCKEEDKYEVQRILYKEFKLLLESNNIKIGATGIEETA